LDNKFKGIKINKIYSGVTKYTMELEPLILIYSIPLFYAHFTSLSLSQTRTHTKAYKPQYIAISFKPHCCFSPSLACLVKSIDSHMVVQNLNSWTSLNQILSFYFLFYGRKWKIFHGNWILIPSLFSSLKSWLPLIFLIILYSPASSLSTR